MWVGLWVRVWVGRCVVRMWVGRCVGEDVCR